MCTIVLGGDLDIYHVYCGILDIYHGIKVVFWPYTCIACYYYSIFDLYPMVLLSYFDTTILDAYNGVTMAF